MYDFSSMKTYKMLVIPLCRMLHFDMSEGKHFPKEFLNPQKIYILSEEKKIFLHMLVPVCREAALMTRVGKRFTREMEVEKVGRDPRTEMEVWPLWEKRWKGGGLD